MAKRSVPEHKTRILGLALIVTGTLFVGISTSHNLLRFRSLRLDQKTVQAYMDQAQESVPQVDPAAKYPVHIFIKWYVDVGIEPAVYTRGDWTVSPTQASYLVSSGSPGGSGNIVIYGHNKRGIMGNIRALKGGETVTLTMKDGSSRSYRVVSMREVSPADTALIQPTGQETLTLYTCSGIMDSRRFVVRAEPITPKDQAVSL